MARETVKVRWIDIHPCQCEQVIARHKEHLEEMVVAWLCDTCGKPYIPKHFEERYSTCQKCHYGF